MKNIKDMSPSKSAINELEKLLIEVKAGEVRSLVYCVAYDDNTTAHGWALDSRNNSRSLLGEIRMLEHDYIVSTELEERYSELCKVLDE